MDPALFEGLFTEILAPLVNGTLSKLSDGAKVQWKKVQDHQAAKAYKEKLTKRYGTIQILGQPRPQKLGKVYTDVFLHEKPTHSYASGIESLEEQFQERGKRFGRNERTDGLAFAKKHDRLFILGKPGAGKTTFLKYLTMQAAQSDIPLVPIFISLNDFQHQKTELLDYMAEQFDVCDFPDAGPFIQQLLTKGKGLILFDGLDEVSKENNQRIHITRQLKIFIEKYDLNNIVITCRIAASDYNFQNFAYVEMADFTDKQAEAFVRRWFAESKSKINGFLKELEGSDNKGIKEMTTSPLLLTLLCIQFDGSMALPPSRSEVYEEALEVLLKTWDGHRDINRGDLIVEDEDMYKALTFKRKMQLMSRLAWGTFKEGNLFIEQKWLQDNIVKYLGKIPKGPDPDLVDGSVVLKAIESQHGLLVERASRIYSFSHLTLQEYFTAKYIVDHAQTDAALSTLVSAEKITDPRWHEVFMFVAELLPVGDKYIIWFAEMLQEMACKNNMQKLIHWVEIRSFERPFSKNQMVSRISFLARTLDHTRSRALYLALVLDSSLARPLDKAFAFALVNIFKRSSMLSNALNCTRAFDLDPNRNLALGLVFSRALDQGYYDSLSSAINESEALGWNELKTALNLLPKPDENAPEDEWREIWKAMDIMEREIIFRNWRWEIEDTKDIENLTIWLNAHELLFSCLDRVVLEDLDRKEFEGEYLYRLPPHARPELGDGA